MIIQIANHLWQSTLFAAGIAALCMLLRNDAARIRYWLWWAASIKFLVPLAVLEHVGSTLVDRFTVTPGAIELMNVVTVAARPFETAQAPGWPAYLLAALWLIGALVVLARWLRRALHLRKLLAEAECDPQPLVCDGAALPVYRTGSSLEPGIVGWWRPVLILPRGIDEKLSRTQLQSIYAHELCHVRRRDNLTAAAHMLVELIFWFYPLVWWIGARLVDERERACDEMVMALGHDRVTYANSILDVCERYVASPLRCAAGISGSDLKQRVTRIMRHRGTQDLTAVKKSLLAIAALAAVVVALACSTQQDVRAQDRPPMPPALGRECNFLRDLSDVANRGPDCEYLPIIKSAPRYPPAAAASRLEGYVIVSYTVRPDGTVGDIEVVESSSPLFEEGAIESVRGYRYVPRLVDGEAQAVEHVRTRLEFVLEGEASNRPVVEETPDDSGRLPETIVITGE